MRPFTLTVVLAVAGALAGAFGCSKEEETLGIPIMTEVGKIAPQLDLSARGGAAAPRAVTFVDDLPESVATVVGEFLRFACHSMDGSFDVCAEYGIELEGGYAESPYSTGSENFMGMMSAFGARFDEVYMHPDEVVTCGRFDGTAKSPAFVGSTQFLLGADGGFVASLDCVAKARYGDGPDTYFAYSADLERASFLTTGLGDPGRGSYIYQGYARRDRAGASAAIAMSSPVLNLNGSAERLVFVGNLETHRIALKWAGFGADGVTRKAVAVIGVGGITADGPVAGHYGLYAETMNDDGILEAATVCVDNGARSIVAAADAAAACSDPIIGAWLDGTSGWEEVVAWVGLTAEDQAVIGADWGALLGAGAALTAGDVPWGEEELVAAIE